MAKKKTEEVQPKKRTPAPRKKASSEPQLGVANETSKVEKTFEEKKAERKALGMIGSQQIVKLDVVTLPNGMERNRVLTAAGVTYHLTDADLKEQQKFPK